MIRIPTVYPIKMLHILAIVFLCYRLFSYKRLALIQHMFLCYYFADCRHKVDVIPTRQFAASQ